MDGLYAYCVGERTGKGERPARIALRESGASVPIAVVPYRDIEAMVTTVPLGDFSRDSGRKRLEDERWLTAKVLAHEQVVEEVIRLRPPVIPFKFATVFRSRERLTTMLRSHYTRFQELLRQLHGHAEWGVKLFSDAEVLGRALRRDDPRLRQLRTSIRGAPAGKGYFLQRALEERRREVVREQQEQVAQEFLAMVRPHADTVVSNDVLPRTVTGRSDEMLGNFALLVAEERVGALRAALDHWNRANRQRGTAAVCTGPWPAYHFVTL